MVLKLSTWIFLFFCLCLGVALFQVKYTVSDLENMHKSLKREILARTEELHILNAEWAYLNNPVRLQKLANKYLKLHPITSERVISYVDIKNSNLGNDHKTLDYVLKNFSQKTVSKTKK
jgi:cell division protein FtsL